MAIITSTKSGNWSSPSTWVGGVVPVDTNAVVIAAGHAVLMDFDTSNFTAGIQGVTITGAPSGNPGSLYFANGTNGYLKIATGFTIAGTNNTVNGQLVATSDGNFSTATGISFVQSTNTVTTSGSTFSGATLTNNTPVTLISTGTIPTPLALYTTYWVVNASGSTFQLSATVGGTAITLTNAGTGTISAIALNFARIGLTTTANVIGQYLSVKLLGSDPATFTGLRGYGTTYPFTYSGSGNTIQTVNGVGSNVVPTPAWTTGATGTPVQVSCSSGGTLPTGLTAGTQYYILTNTGGSITLSATQNGVAVVLSGSTSGTCYITTGALTVTSIAANTITMPANHGWAIGQYVMFTSTGTYPTGISPNTMYHILAASNNTFTIATSINVTIAIVLGTTWSGTLTAYVGPTATNTSSIAVLDDPTLDIQWMVGTYAVIVNEVQAAAYDQQRFRINAVCPTVITMGWSGSDLTNYTTGYNLINAKNPNAMIYLVSRNVAIRSTSTTASILLNFNTPNADASCALACEVNNTAGVAASYYGNGVGSSTITVSISGGSFCGLTNVLTAVNVTVSGGVFVANSSCLTTCPCTVSGGTFAGNSTAFSGCNTITISNATVVGCTSVLLTCTGSVNGGTFIGNSNVINNSTITVGGGTFACNNNVVSSNIAPTINAGTFTGNNVVMSGSQSTVTGGTFTGNYNVFSSARQVVSSGTFSNNQSVFNTCSGSYITGGTFSLNSVVVSGGSGVIIGGGTFSNNTTVISGADSITISAGTFSGNTGNVIYGSSGTISGNAMFFANGGADIYANGVGQLICYGLDIRSTTQVSTYIYNTVTMAVNSNVGVFGFNVRDTSGPPGAVQMGWLKCYTPGGTIITAAGNTSGNFNGTFGGSDVTFVHVATFQSNVTVNCVDIPIYGFANQKITVNIATKASTTSNWTTAPHMAIVDPDVGWNNPTLTSDELATTGLLNIADTSWHTTTLTYTPTSTGPLKLRIAGQGGNSGGTGTGNMTIAYRIATPGGFLKIGMDGGII